MSLLTPTQRLFENLKQAIPPNAMPYMKREDAYNRLKELTGQDFGYDHDQWENWLIKNAKDFTYGSYGERKRKERGI